MSLSLLLSFFGHVLFPNSIHHFPPPVKPFCQRPAGTAAFALRICFEKTRRQNSLPGVDKGAEKWYTIVLCPAGCTMRDVPGGGMAPAAAEMKKRKRRKQTCGKKKRTGPASRKAVSRKAASRRRRSPRCAMRAGGRWPKAACWGPLSAWPSLCRGSAAAPWPLFSGCTKSCCGRWATWCAARGSACAFCCPLPWAAWWGWRSAFSGCASCWRCCPLRWWRCLPG